MNSKDRSGLLYYIKQFILRGFFGVFIGAFIGQMFFVVSAFNNEVITVASEFILKQFTVASLVGFYCAGVSVVYDIEEWSFLKQTVSHFIIMTIPYFILANFAGWIPKHPLGLSAFIAAYITLYLIIWFSFKRYWKKKAEEMVKQLRRLNDEDRV